MNIKENKSIEIITILISLISMVISFRACQTSNDANDLSLDSNEIALQANSITSEINRFQMTYQSLSIVRDAYDNIYSDEQNRLVIEKLAKGENVKNRFNLLRVIDIFEDMGDLFCSGNIYRVNLRTQLSSTIKYACENKQVLDEFKGKKNGLAMLCYEFLPNSLFAKTITGANISDCKFLDLDNRLAGFSK